MPDPATYRPAPGSIPVEPGVYRFRDPHGRVIYVGKAKSLRSRLNSYFADLSGLAPRTRQMVTTAASVEWTVVDTEVEALQLEYNWIKEFDPRFNIRYRDDKSYPVLAVTLNEEYPRLKVYRGPRRKGVRYFGPYSHAWAIRETLDLLTRVFPARTCSAGVFKRHSQIDRPCLLGYIDKCSAPCVGRVSADEHRQIVLDFCDFLAGKTDRLVREMEQQMNARRGGTGLRAGGPAARQHRRAAPGDGEAGGGVRRRHRRRRGGVRRRRARSRGAGVPRARRSGARPARLDRRKVRRTRRIHAGIPRRAVPHPVLRRPGRTWRREPAGRGHQPGARARCWSRCCRTTPTNWRPGCRSCAGPGSRCGCRSAATSGRWPRRCKRNAEGALTQHKLKRAGDFTARSAALQSIQESLGLADAPLRIECVDISHVQGTDVVASLVVFEDGLPRKSDYRHYAIKEAAGDGRSDDVASIAEVTRRRFHRHLHDVEHPRSAERHRLAEGSVASAFAYPPNLFVVDGGAPQVNAAAAVLDELGITDVAVIGLAKRLEEVWVPSEPDPVIMPRNSEGLYLLQRVRDEAHRFAITYHRSKRSKRMTASALDSVRGSGRAPPQGAGHPFRSVARLKQASVEEITAVPGIGAATARAVLEALGVPPSDPGVPAGPPSDSGAPADGYRQ